MIRPRGVLVGICLAMSVVVVAYGSGSAVVVPSTVPPAEITGERHEALPVRGVGVQVTPTQPPPPSTTTSTLPPLPPPDWCPPGMLVRRVDTGGERLVAFTFDDGPSGSNTRPIMDTFASRGYTAAFFVIGINVRSYPDVMREIVDRGFTVGNHTVTHSYSVSVITREISSANDIIRSYTGEQPVFFRSPGLVQASSIQNTLRGLGMCNVFHSVDLRDWVSPRRSASQLCTSFGQALHPGMIVLLHDGGSSRPTRWAVPCMLDIAEARGYRVVSLGELMRSGEPRSI